MPLRVAVLALCAWCENLACGVARQSIANSARQRNEVSVASLATKRRSTTNSMKYNEVASVCEQNNVWRHGKFSLASVAKMGGACGQSKQSENGTSVWAGDFSLSLSLVSQLFICSLFFQFFKIFCSSCHFERSEKSTFHIQHSVLRVLCGYFAALSMTNLL